MERCGIPGRRWSTASRAFPRSPLRPARARPSSARRRSPSGGRSPSRRRRCARRGRPDGDAHRSSGGRETSRPARWISRASSTTSSMRSCSMPVRLPPGFTSMKMPMPVPLHSPRFRASSTSAETATLGNSRAISATRCARGPQQAKATSTSAAPASQAVQEFERGGAFEVAQPVRRHLAHRGNQFRGLDVGAPALGVAVQTRQSLLDVVVDNLGEYQQRGRQQIRSDLMVLISSIIRDGAPITKAVAVQTGPARRRFAGSPCPSSR